jgi:HNH endonuclease
LRKLPNQSIVRDWLDYDAVTGLFRWRRESRPCNPVLGEIAGTINKKTGYVLIGIRGYHQIAAQALAWIYVHGLTIGGAEIDHIDTNPTNNAIGNLRLATSSEQKQNRKVQSNNRSGLKGAYYHACHKGKKWRSQIKVREDGIIRLIFLGYFHTAQEAHEAYGRAAIKYFGEFARAA